MAVLDEVKSMLGDVLQIGDRTDTLTEASGLIGVVPEFDSMAVVSVMTAIEEHYGILIDDDEVSAETFETVGSLVSFVESKI